jgi:hypothetical protein
MGRRFSSIRQCPNAATGRVLTVWFCCNLSDPLERRIGGNGVGSGEAACDQIFAYSRLKLPGAKTQPVMPVLPRVRIPRCTVSR